jgi:hypothetical protein
MQLLHPLRHHAEPYRDNADEQRATPSGGDVPACGGGL